MDAARAHAHGCACDADAVPDPAPTVGLVPLADDLLPAVQPWFRHPEVRRRLGGPEWPVRELRLLTSAPGEEHRGAVVLRAHSWVALDPAGCAVAKVGGEVYDRWTRYDGFRGGRPSVTEVEPGPAMALTYVVDPARWRQGIGRAVLRAAVQHPDVADVRIFTAGIDADNEASRRCAASAGFVADVDDADDADWEGTVSYLLRRPPARSSTGRPPT